MKCLVLGIDGIDPRSLLGDQRLTRVQSLLWGGVAGVLVEASGPDHPSWWRSLVSGREADRGPDPMIWEAFGLTEAEAVSGDPSLLTHRSLLRGGPEPGGETMPGSVLVALAEDRGWEFRMLLLRAPEASSIARDPEDRWRSSFDTGLGRLLDMLLDTGTPFVVLLVCRGMGDGGGAFVLASSLGLPAGELEGVRLVDLAPTLLKLAGRRIPEAMVGRPLRLEQVGGGDASDEEAVLERLRGLGYLA